MAHVQEKKKPKTVPEEAQKLELFDKGFKSAFPNMFKNWRTYLKKQRNI